MFPTLIRNIDQPHCFNFLEHGKLRLKPVVSYKDTPDPARIDETEGGRGIEARPQSNISVLSDKLWTPENILFRGTNPNARPVSFIGAGGTLSLREVLPQALVLCLSEDRILKFGDAAFVVNDAVQFGRHLCAALNASGNKISKWRLKKVSYGGHKDRATNQENFEKISASLMSSDESEGYFMKPTEYAAEREWRYIYVVEDRDRPLAQVDIFDKALIEYCQAF